MEMGQDGGDLCGAAYTRSGSFPPVSDLLSSLQDSILSPQENTDKFTMCGLRVNHPALGSVRPYSSSVSPSEEDEPSSLCSLPSDETHRSFQRTRNLPEESDESIPEFYHSTSSEERRREPSRPQYNPLHRGALQCRSTANQSQNPVTGQCHGSVQGGSSSSSSGSQGKFSYTDNCTIIFKWCLWNQNVSYKVTDTCEHCFSDRSRSVSDLHPRVPASEPSYSTLL